MARVGADRWCADLGQVADDGEIEEFDSARAAASAGVMGEVRPRGDKTSGDGWFDRLCGEHPSPLVSCHQKISVSPWG